MPKDKDDEMPETIKRSPEKARRTWKKTHDSAVKSYGEGERAHKTAYSSLKHSFEKVGDHWEPKDEKGPSDSRAQMSYKEAERKKPKSYGGVDFLGHSKKELQDQARKVGAVFNQKMSKDELAEAIDRKQKQLSRKKK